MLKTKHLMTVGEYSRDRGVPEWMIRRLVDQVAPGLPRLGGYRLIPIELVPELDRSLAERTKLKCNTERTAETSQ